MAKTRPFLRDPLEDPELKEICDVVTLTADTPGLRDGEEPSDKTMPEAGEYIAQLTASQLSLLKAALLHAIGPGHGGQVHPYTRTTGYKMQGIGLEVIDGTWQLGSQTPLAIVFIESS